MVREISAYADVKRQILFHREFKLSISQFVLNKLFHIERNARYFTVKSIIYVVTVKSEEIKKTTNIFYSQNLKKSNFRELNTDKQ